ncbi:Proclotting enzyme-like 3 [Homarus americanus]|uniref:Proclotting enzyme-like 3 n=1 Tax=Homarus americanus TaxID=6706 RepID=A0A8J5TLI1_HOMAM|nr:Proclotting enzyme-like 3 [Homarus americanus]
MRTLLLVAMTVAVVVAGGEVQEESHSRYKRQYPITGQYVPDVDRDSFGNPVGNFPATGFPGANEEASMVASIQEEASMVASVQEEVSMVASVQEEVSTVVKEVDSIVAKEVDSREAKEVDSIVAKEVDSIVAKEVGSREAKEVDSKEAKEVDSKEATYPQGAGSTAGGGAGGGAGFPNVSDYARLNIGNGQPDVRYQECVTPRRQFGRCRHLQYCILPEFLNNYSLFVRYACVIRNTFIGVCCSRHTVDLGTTLELSTPTPTPAPAPRCGVSDRTTTRIVGGVATSPGEFPWVVSILRRDATPNQYCAGVLISNRHVLTVAHCLAGFDFRHIWARVGEHDFDREGDTPSTNVRIADFRLHKDFNPRDFNNDIAILVLEQPVIYNDFVIPICLPPSSQQFTGDTVTVAGWGAVKHEGPVSSVLRKVSLPVWTNTDCDEAYDQPIRDSMICAGFPGGGRDACQDDSGGPMMVQVNGTWTIVGLVSFGVKCAEPGIPGVYTRVNYFLDWISDNI